MVPSFAQKSKHAIFSHPITVAPGSFSPRTFSVVPETLHLLAVMVEFKEEIPDDDRSSGNGRFDLGDSSKKMIDVPPHDKPYFEQHLLFAENYFRKVSNGKLIVKGTILDSVYRLPDVMRAYSPPRGSTTFTELGSLMSDTWHIVDSSSRIWGDTIPFQNYQAFTIFHAGVGHDIDLVSLYGYDPTPFDIPSIYLNLTSLRKMFGESYQGVPVADSAFFIRNSMILPETETRILQSIGGTVTIKLGINGLLAASIGSHLGLPDLFDTKTGSTGIGRFGLMDGQSIFSWGGIFPPEPSAWEKYFLGWLNPITISSGDTTCELPAVSLNSEPDSVYRILISAREYFLVENRNRDANQDGATVTMMFNGDTITKTWMRDTVNFDFVDQDSLYGVVIDVDEYDWSLPGGNFSVRGVKDWYDGGVLIWHIDENIIEANYSTGTVNANPDRRGVDLEEGDGAQDIGQSYGFLSAGSGTEDGTPFDFWFANNPLRQRQLANEFTPTSAPNSLSNGGANSHVYIKDFSTRGPRMTARIQVGDEVIKALRGFPKGELARPIFRNSITVGDLLLNDSAVMLISSRWGIFGWNINGTAISGFRSNGLLVHSFVPWSYNAVKGFYGKVIINDLNGDSYNDFATIGIISDLGNDNSFLNIWTVRDNNRDSLADEVLYKEYSGPLFMTSAINCDSILVAGKDNQLVFVKQAQDTLSSIKLSSIDTNFVVGICLWNRLNNFVAATANGQISIVNTSAIILQKDFGQHLMSPPVAGNLLPLVGKHIAFASQDGYVYLADSTLSTVSGFPFLTNGEILNSPALADVDGDGQRDIIVFSRNKIWAINAAGAVLDNFPIAVNTENSIRTSPIVADLDGNGTVDIVAVTQEGLVVAYDKTGKMVRGFPLLTGPNGGSTPAALYMPGSSPSTVDIGLAVASDDGHVYAWKTGTIAGTLSTVPQMPWPQYMHDAQNTGLVEDALALNPISSNFFPASRAYNWPNPVGAEQNFKTYIRYYVRDNAKVTIKIFDMAGDLVAEFPGPGVGGFDNEVEWDVRNIQSGVYFGRIDALGTSGSGSTVIKIAVIK